MPSHHCHGVAGRFFSSGGDDIDKRKQSLNSNASGLEDSDSASSKKDEKYHNNKDVDPNFEVQIEDGMDSSKSAAKGNNKNSIVSGKNTSTFAVPQSVTNMLQQAQDRTIVFFNVPIIKERWKNRRAGPVMNTEWWIWNIALALMPALVLAIFFEYKTPQMHAYYEKLNNEQRNRLRQVIMAEDLEVEENDDAADIESGYNKVEENINAPHVPISHHNDGDGAETNVIPLAGQIPQQKNDEIKQRTLPQSLPPLKPVEMTKVDIPELQRRLELLEYKLQQFENSGQIREGPKHELEKKRQKQERLKERQLKYQMERLQQSGIQNRLEDKIIGIILKEEQDHQNMIASRRRRKEDKIANRPDALPPPGAQVVSSAARFRELDNGKDCQNDTQTNMSENEPSITRIVAPDRVGAPGSLAVDSDSEA